MSPARPVPTDAHTRAKGSSAEDLGVAYLEAQGYEILERNVFNKVGEIDVVALDGDTLCIVEIKSRHTDEFGPAIAGVTPRKMRRLAKVASMYLAYQKKPTWEGPVRFDVLGMDAEGGEWKYTLLRNAFEA